MKVTAMSARFAPREIRAQVAKILSSEHFVRSQRMQRFLDFVIEETLAGRIDQLGEYAIGTAVFDRGSDFEPAIDAIVRNDARRLPSKLLEYYRNAPEDRVVIEIPKGGYAPVFVSAAASRKESAQRRLAVLPFEVLSTAPGATIHARALCVSITAGFTNLDGVMTIAHGYLGEQPALQLTHAIHGSIMSTGEQLWACS
jgi:hypothetical protein